MSDPDGEWIEINPPDEDGDVVVRLVNRPNWHVAAHGDTPIACALPDMTMLPCSRM